MMGWFLTLFGSWDSLSSFLFFPWFYPTRSGGGWSICSVHIKICMSNMGLSHASKSNNWKEFESWLKVPFFRCLSHGSKSYFFVFEPWLKVLFLGVWAVAQSPIFWWFKPGSKSYFVFPFKVFKCMYVIMYIVIFN